LTGQRADATIVTMRTTVGRNLSRAVSRSLLACYAGLTFAVVVFAFGDFLLVGVLSIPYVLLIWFGSRRPISAGFLLVVPCAIFGLLLFAYVEATGWMAALVFVWLFAAPCAIGIGLVATGAVDAWRRSRAERAYWETEIETRPPLPNP
jgi:hypothetical protein